VELYLFSPNTCSWNRAYLSTVTSLPLPSKFCSSHYAFFALDERIMEMSCLFLSESTEHIFIKFHIGGVGGVYTQSYWVNLILVRIDTV
jgi:hypothetical protein